MNKVYDLVISEIKKKKYNLNGGISDNGGLDITPNLVFGNLDPNAGHMAKVNMSTVNVDAELATVCFVKTTRERVSPRIVFYDRHERPMKAP